MDIDTLYKKIFNPFAISPSEMRMLTTPEDAARFTIGWFIDHPDVLQEEEEPMLIRAIRAALNTCAGLSWEALADMRIREYNVSDWRVIAWKYYCEKSYSNSAMLARLIGVKRHTVYNAVHRAENIHELGFLEKTKHFEEQVEKEMKYLRYMKNNQTQNQ